MNGWLGQPHCPQWLWIMCVCLLSDPQQISHSFSVYYKMGFSPYVYLIMFMIFAHLSLVFSWKTQVYPFYIIAIQGPWWNHHFSTRGSSVSSSYHFHYQCLQSMCSPTTFYMNCSLVSLNSVHSHSNYVHKCKEVDQKRCLGSQQLT